MSNDILIAYIIIGREETFHSVSKFLFFFFIKDRESFDILVSNEI